ncbi:hypothetical protein [Halomarina ordinaria]|uniref:Major facilitator superfamily (MFS) profile domain-containing protein n=1 Tax=Halomarina ordinaria TaxID=3033939 RepID=A0ABD5UCI4_9EURY|nr:hypothetical protein [Halomarina sp. PSRA2]
MFEALLEDVGFLLFGVGAIGAVAVLAVWMTGLIPLTVTAALMLLFTLGCLGGLFKHLLDAMGGPESPAR